MQFKKLLVFASLCALILLSFTACKKTDSTDLNSSFGYDRCLIATATEQYAYLDVENYYFTYNTNKQLTNIQGTGRTAFYTSFTYDSLGKYILRNNYNSLDSFVSKDSMTLNAAGLITAYYSGAYNDSVLTNRYVYDASNQLMYSLGPSPIKANDSIAYFWVNGDYVSRYDNFIYDVRTVHDPSRLATHGDYTYYQQMFQYGSGLVFKNTHMVDTIVNASASTAFKYTYDAGGKVTRIDLTTGVVSYNSTYFITYGYSCE